MPVSLYPTEEEQPTDRDRPEGVTKTAPPRLTTEQRAGLLGLILGFILCGIIAWVGWVSYSALTHVKSAPPARVPLPIDAMREAVTVTVAAKTFVSSGTENRRVEGLQPTGRLEGEQILIAGGVANGGSRDIRAFRGDLVFSDVFGEEIKSVSWTYERGVKVGEHKRYETALVYDPMIPGDQKLRTTALADMTVRWEPRTVVFADGTMLRK